MADTDKLQQVLNVYDPILKSMDITLFFSQKDKDTVPPNLLLDWINCAAPVAKWNTDDSVLQPEGQGHRPAQPSPRQDQPCRNSSQLEHQ
jgi:hypothetical protein